MDYKVGQEYAFIHIDYTPSGVPASRYLPWQDRLNEIRIEVMECVDHQNTPVPDPEQGGWCRPKRHLGFAFIDRFGEMWGCNYRRPEHPLFFGSAGFTLVALEGLRMRSGGDLISPPSRYEKAEFVLETLIGNSEVYAINNRCVDGTVEADRFGGFSEKLMDLQAAIRLKMAIHMGVYSDVSRPAANHPAFKNITFAPKKVTFLRRSEVNEEKYLEHLAVLHRQVNASDYALEVMKKITIV